MTWTRATYMDQARAQADARSSQDWSDSDVRYALGMVHTREWKRLLDANQYLRTNTLSLTQNASGQIPFASLDQGSADAQQRFYRVLWVSDGVRVYDEAQWGHLPTATTSGGANYVRPLWYPTASGATQAIQCLPIASGLAMTVVVNHTPTPIDQLSDDSIAVEFPRDYEMLIAVETAAWLLAKGGRETNATADLQRLADQIRAEMLGDLVRVSTSPTQIGFPDSRRDWDGF